MRVDNNWIPESKWRSIVENVPIVSVDLLVHTDGKLLLGKRSNEPAKGYWFVPGGRVQKGEHREDAVQRIASNELHLNVEITERLGAYEHLYSAAETDGVDDKHYLATGYVVNILSGELASDDQHSELRYFQNPPNPLHPYVEQYLEAAETLPHWP